MGVIMRKGVCYSSDSSSEKELTYAEYQALTKEEQMDGTTYYITDRDSGDGGSSSGINILTMTKDEFISLEPKPTTGIIGIRQGYNIKMLLDMAYYKSNANLPYTNAFNLLVDADVLNYKQNASNWGGLTIAAPKNLSAVDDAIQVDAISNEALFYELQNGKSYTAYIVMKMTDISPAGGDFSEIIGSAYSYSAANCPMIMTQTSGQVYVTIYGSGYNTPATINCKTSYAVLAMSVNDNTKTAKFYDYNGFIKQFTYSNTGSKITILRGYGLLKGLVKYIGIVNEPEDEEIIMSNIQNLSELYL